MDSQATYWTPHLFQECGASSAQATVGGTVAAQNHFSSRNWRGDPLRGHQEGIRIFSDQEIGAVQLAVQVWLPTLPSTVKCFSRWKATATA